MSKVVFRNARIVNRNKITESDLLVVNDRIEKIAANIKVDNAEEVEMNGLWLLPGIIDDQVHFREPGLTHKANIACLLYTSPSPRDRTRSRMPSSA